ncbi:MAG TPA: formylglycine-generating enzyme family protein [Accumulibacter sp.]|nr:formylglycine-generating enzyme family protein [Accumulibacter sp.]
MTHRIRILRGAVLLGVAGAAWGFLPDEPKPVPKAVPKAAAKATPKPRQPAAPAVAPRAKAAGQRRPGEVFKDCADCPEMVVIPAGSFEMGSPSFEAGRWENEGSVHRVAVAEFALGRTEITRGQFAAFVTATGYQAGDKCWTFGGKLEERSGRSWRNPGFPQEDSHPVVCVNWNDAGAYAEWLSRKTGKRYRLPSEAEWEYAARAGSVTSRYWGESPNQACGYANVVDATGKSQLPGFPEAHNCNDGSAYTAGVGSYKANPFGLYDMIGNASEWTQDCWNKSYNGAPGDGSAWTSGDCGRRVLRGGSWDVEPRNARSALRDWFDSTDQFYFIGFRLARMLP